MGLTDAQLEDALRGALGMFQAVDLKSCAFTLSRHFRTVASCTRGAGRTRARARGVQARSEPHRPDGARQPRPRQLTDTGSTFFAAKRCSLFRHRSHE